MNRTTIAALLLALFLTITLASQNSIVTENLLPGNPASQWDVSGSGDPTIQGFATDISVNKGQTIHFKINTDASAYTIKIYRLGYYQGNGARFIDNGVITAALPQSQPAYLYDSNTGLVDCGNWIESGHWDVPATAVSGYYIARLERTDNGGASHIVFIVRDDTSYSDLIFKASDATWQAYNVFGGNSLYLGTTSFPSGHAAKVSYNRPFVTRDGGGGGGEQEDWLFNAEYPMIRWLERNGYDVTYTTCIDVARYGNLLLNHQVFLSVGHDEYWSMAERTNVEAARDAGVHLAFFSGNEIYWKTRWENSTDSSDTPYRTLVCYKEGDEGENVCGTKCDPLPNIWTGLWRNGCDYSGTDGCNPENSLSGQISWDGTTGAIEVPDTYKNLRFWRNTSVATLPVGQTATLSQGTLGYEWDWEQYQTFYPAGRILMSETSLNTHTHHLSLYRSASGALVFGAVTVQWSWGLDGNHDRGGSVEDIRMQQATVNLFADMGVQPATLQAGLVPATASSDFAAPVSVITDPVNGDTLAYGVQRTITGTATDNVLVAGVEISTDGGATWHSATGTTTWTYNWIPLTSGTVNILSRAFDDSGNLENPGAGIIDSVTPAPPAVCPCTVFNSWDVPTVELANDGQPIETGMKFQSGVAGYVTAIRFYKGTGTTGAHTGNLWSANGTLIASQSFTSESASGWQEVTLGTPVALNANTTYVVSCFSSSGDYPYTENYFTVPVTHGPLHALADGEEGANGVYSYGSGFPTDSYQASNYWVDVVFTENVGPDTIPPTVLSTHPVNGATNVNINSAITVTFTEAIDQSTLTSSTLELRDNTSTLIPVSIAYNIATHTATLTPLSPLAWLTSYTVTAHGGVSYNRIKDVSGNAMTNDYSCSFTTAGPPPPVPTQGPGGPILVISSALNPFSLYPVEILRAEGFNEFTAMDITAVNATVLTQYDVVILGDVDLNSTEVSMISNWTTAGGTLIAFHPDTALSSLLGITPTGNTLADKYLLVNTASGPGVGITNQTIQYHGSADLYTLSGATALATLYSDATTPTTYPAVTLHTVGTNGGQAIAFTYDLARSVVYTRQGNPAWAGQERDSQSPIRSDDLFFPDWIDLNKVAIPQADEQMHLLSNLILTGNMDRMPLPRFWFLPKEWKAAIVMTGDDHGDSGMQPRFDGDIAASTPGCSVQDWDCIRSTGYLYVGSTFTDSMARHYDSLGFEVSLHINTDCQNVNSSQYTSILQFQQSQFETTYPSIPLVSNRNHCIQWIDWTTVPEVEAQNGVRFDVNYYYWPGSWVNDRPGMFTGSGMPMRFAQADGTMIDCYQAPTQMTDESGISLPGFCDSLLDKANGPEGYYGVFATNMHFDQANHPGANAIVASAVAHQVPVVSAKQMLTWVDARNNSSFNSMTWSNNVFYFTVNADTNANNMRAMIPVYVNGNQLVSVARNGSPVTYTQELIKGIEYAFVPAQDGNYEATYSVAPALTISTINAVPNANGTAAITWTTNLASDSRVNFDTTAAVQNSQGNSSLVVAHSVVLNNLIAGETYFYRVTSSTGSDSATAPAFPAPPLTFTMPSSWCAEDQTNNEFSAGSDTNTVVVSINDGDVILQPALNEEFNTTSIPSGWNDAIWDAQPGAVTTFDGSEVTVDGTHIYTSATYGSTVSLEFAATFTSGNFQNIGFTGDPDFNAPWVVIGQGVSNGTVSARTSDNEVVSLGSGLLNAEHIYRIDRNASGSFAFYVDGVLIPTPGIAMTTTANLYVQISDYPAGAPGVTVDWLRITPYASTGTYTSRIFDNGDTTTWGNVMWHEIIPANTTLAIFARGGDTPAPDTSWTAFLPMINGGQTGITSRYLQYKAILSTTDPNTTPILEDIHFGCSSAIVCVPPVAYISAVDSILCQGGVIQLQLDSATGQSPYTLVVNGNTYTNVVPGQIFTTFTSSPSSIWGATGSPANPNGNDAQPIETGVKFRSATNGFITGVRFYKGAGNPETRVGHLWTSGGTLLATGTINADSLSGWHEIIFPAPVYVSANTTYIASCFSSGGWFAITTNYFTSTGVTNGDLTALQSGFDGPNGVYAYGGGFPSAGGTANYWIDVLFNRTMAGDTTMTYVLTNIADANGCTDSGDTLAAVNVTVSPYADGILAAQPTCDGQNVYLSFTSGNGAGPYSIVVNNTTYSNVMSGVPFNSGVVNGNGTSQSIWDSTAVPATITANDNAAIELGVKFRSDTAGSIMGIRFYKGPMNTGVHTGSLWTSTGVMLATATFMNESASGWQEVLFSAPVQITPNTTYIASYHTSVGNYSFDASYFTSSGFTNDHLYALQNGEDGPNGVYEYSSSPQFPTSTFNAGNYWVDVVFGQPDLAFTLTSVANSTGCNANVYYGPVEVPAVLPLTATITAQQNEPCFGNQAGSAVVSATGGSGNYSYLWNDALQQANDTASNLPIGSFTVRVTDIAGCNDTAWATALITQPAALTASISSSAVQCFNGADGMAGVNASGGTAPYTFAWSDSSSNDSISGLPAGLYWVQLTDSNQCTLRDTIIITQPTAIAFSQTVTICNGDSISIGNFVHNTGGTFVDTLAAANGCDSTVTTVLSVRPYIGSAQSITICNGDSITIGSHVHLAGGTYTDTLVAACACDSIVTTNLTVRPAISDSQSVSVCNGGTITVGSHTYSISGTYVDTLNSINGCDSIITTQLNILPAITQLQSITVCYGDSYAIGTHVYTVNGTYADTLIAVNGCDSIVTTNLTVRAQNAFSQSLSVCFGDNYAIGSHSYTASGIYLDTLTAANGCDSIVTTNLTVRPQNAVSQSISVCFGDNYAIGSHSYTASGIYLDTLAAANGCDSIVTTNLTVRPQNAISQSLSVCFGDNYAIGSHTYTTSGVYLDTLTAANGCDSIVTTNLTVRPQNAISQSLSVCFGDNYAIGSHTYTTSGVYLDTLAAANGCDSIVTTQLSVRPAIGSMQSFSLCAGGSVTVGTHIYTNSGIFHDTLIAASGCDSIVTTDLIVLAQITSSQNVTLCNGDTLVIGQHNYSSGGTYIDTLQAVGGCDSIVTTNLNVLPAITLTQNITICSNDSLQVGTHFYHVTGIYTDTLIATGGCDSVITTSLTVNPQLILNQSITMCTYDSIFVGGAYQHNPGVYYDTLISQAGCDSIIITTLTCHAVDTSITAIEDTLISNAGGTTWQWIDCTADTIIPGATDSLFTPQLSGTYAVIVTENGCTDTSTCYYVLVTGTNETDNNQSMNVFPNPVTDYLEITISGNVTGDIHCVVYNVAGAILKDEQYPNENVVTLDVRSLAAGTYFLEVTTEKQKQVFTFIKY